MFDKARLKYILFIIFTLSSYSVDNRVDVVTDEVTIDFQNEEFVAGGGVTFVYPNADPEKTAKIKAYKLKKANDKNLITASDGVIFQQGQNKVEAKELYFNLDNQNLIVRDGVSYVEVSGAPELNNKIYYGGQEFVAQFPNEAFVKNAWFTTSSKALQMKKGESDPKKVLPYHMKAKKISIFPEQKIVAYNAVLYAGKVPILWLPWYASSLKTDTQAPLFPIIGASNTEGTYILWGIDYGRKSNYFNGSISLKDTTKKGLYIGQLDDVYKISGNNNNKGKLSLTDALILPKGNYETEYKLEHTHAYSGTYGTVNWKYSNQTINTINDVIDALENYKNGSSSSYAYSGVEKNLSRYELSTDLKGLGPSKDMSLKSNIQYVDNKQFLQTLLSEKNSTLAKDIQTDNDVKSNIDFTKDSFLYGINLKYDYLDDLDPGSQTADTISFTNGITTGINLKKYGINVQLSEKKWDQWVSLTDAQRYSDGRYLNEVDGWAKGFSYVPFTVKKYNFYKNEKKLSLGNYTLFNGKLNYGLDFYELEETKELSKEVDPFRKNLNVSDKEKEYFRDENITYTEDWSRYAKLNLTQSVYSLGLEVGEDQKKYIDRSFDDNGITYENNSTYYDGQIRDRIINLKDLGKLDLTLGNRLDAFERGDELNKSYIKGVHDIDLYDNNGNYLRTMDLSLKNNFILSYNTYDFDKNNYNFTSSNGIANVSNENDLRKYRLISQKNNLDLKDNVTLGVGNTATTYGLNLRRNYNSYDPNWLQNSGSTNSIDFKVDDKRTVYLSYGTDKNFLKNSRNSASTLYGVLDEDYFLKNKTNTTNLILADDIKEFTLTRSDTTGLSRDEDYIYKDSNGNYLNLADVSTTYGNIATKEKSISDTLAFSYKFDDKKNIKTSYTRGNSSVYDYSDLAYNSKGVRNQYSIELSNTDLYTLKLNFQDYKDKVTSINDEKRFTLRYDFKKNNLPKSGNEKNVELVDSTGESRLSLTEEELMALDQKYKEEKRAEQGLGFDIMGIGEEKKDVIYKQYYSLYIDGIRNEDYYRASNEFMDSLESLQIKGEAHYNRFKLTYDYLQTVAFATSPTSLYGISKTVSAKEHDFSVLTMIGKDSKSWKIKGEIGLDETETRSTGLLDKWSVSLGKEFDFMSTTLKYQQTWNSTYNIYDWTWSINFALLTFPDKGVSVGESYKNGSTSPEIKTGI